MLVQLLSLISIANALYTFARKRHYRLFENNIDVAPSTPNAHRVRVDSSPVSSSPLRFLSKVIGDTTAQARSHPDATRDVWELAVWDPMPICLRLFCLFSPGHVLVYWLFLPIGPLDPRPTMTVLTTIVMQILLSAQLLLLQSNFSQQAKDTALIHKEVLNEYDVKYVHPQLNPTVRDVATQFSSSESGSEISEEVDTYNPTTILRRGFKIHPNPNYASHISPDNPTAVPPRNVMSPAPFRTPSQRPRESTPLRTVQQAALRQPQFRQSMGPTTSSTAMSTGTSMGRATAGDGGSLGIYSHANSPLKKSSSMDYMGTPRNSLQAAGRERQEERERERSKSPLKKLAGEETRRTSMPSGFAPIVQRDKERKSGYW
jgi:hypothetical protein